MSYKYPNLPSAQAHKEETADFWELQAICNPGIFISQTNISKIISKELDEISHDGIESDDDHLDEKLDDVHHELNNRIKYTGQKYPFEFGRYSIKIKEEDNIYKNIYLFLLLATRFNMLKKKKQNGIDGTLLFEKLCQSVVRNFFGKNSKSIVFGTAISGGFEDKVKNLISQLGEGDAFKNPNNNAPTKNDDSIDIVVWKEFADKKIGKLIGFGQCKTGTTSWRDDIHKLKPSDFCDRWFYNNPVLNPIPIVFITDTMNEDFNFYSSQQGFLIFNRFRILEYLPDNLPEIIINDINNWVAGAFLELDIKN